MSDTNREWGQNADEAIRRRNRKSAFRITADPGQDVGIGIGQSFIAFEGAHDVAASPMTGKRRFVVNLTPDDILWLIESLARELPEGLHDEAVQRIEQQVAT